MNDQAEQKLIREIVVALHLLNKFRGCYPLESRGDNDTLELPDFEIYSEVFNNRDTSGTLLDTTVMINVTAKGAPTPRFDLEFHFRTGDSPIRAAWMICRTINAIEYDQCEEELRCFGDITGDEILALETLWNVGLLGLEENPVLEKAA